MPVVTYTAQRKLASGHTAGTQYQIETDFQRADPSLRAVGFQQQALDLSQSSYLYATPAEWDILADFQTWSTDLDDWQEFLASVSNGETFQVDFTGTIASPGTDVNMVIIRGSWQFNRVGGLLFTVSFRCREV